MLNCQLNLWGKIFYHHILDFFFCLDCEYFTFLNYSVFIFLIYSCLKYIVCWSFQNKIKGYISHQHQKLVVSKQNAFPKLSTVLWCHQACTWPSLDQSLYIWPDVLKLFWKILWNVWIKIWMLHSEITEIFIWILDDLVGN